MKLLPGFCSHIDKLKFVEMFLIHGCVATYTSPPPTAEPLLKEKPWLITNLIAFPSRGRWHFRKKMT
ncbi:MAG: hypothetical protein IJ447_04635, partial [Clostridia bacterium]|nr:hypothetical protein [Clostridia bacterium]